MVDFKNIYLHTYCTPKKIPWGLLYWSKFFFFPQLKSRYIGFDTWVTAMSLTLAHLHSFVWFDIRFWWLASLKSRIRSDQKYTGTCWSYWGRNCYAWSRLHTYFISSRPPKQERGKELKRWMDSTMHRITSILRPADLSRVLALSQCEVWTLVSEWNMGLSQFENHAAG